MKIIIRYFKSFIVTIMLLLCYSPIKTIKKVPVEEPDIVIEQDQVQQIEEIIEEQEIIEDPIVEVDEPVIEVEIVQEPQYPVVEIDYNRLLEQQLIKVPSKIVNAIYNSNWRVELTEENLSLSYFDGQYYFVQGVTDYSNQIILLAKDEKSISEATIHEIGHFVDYYANFPSFSDEFAVIYNEEAEMFKANIVNPGCVTSESEFFAEMMYYLYTDPAKCTPKARNYLENIINNI